jgi:hypothetical protein
MGELSEGLRGCLKWNAVSVSGIGWSSIPPPAFGHLPHAFRMVEGETTDIYFPKTPWQCPRKVQACLIFAKAGRDSGLEIVAGGAVGIQNSFPVALFG